MSFSYSGAKEYDVFTNTALVSGDIAAGGPVVGDDNDNDFEVGEDATGGSGFTYLGFIEIGGLNYPVVQNPSVVPPADYQVLVLVPDYAPYPAFGSITFPATFDMVAGNPGDLQEFTFFYCFAAGTRIDTSVGEVSVEDLTRSHRVRTETGTFEPVKWVGRQTTLRRAHGKSRALVRFRAGSLGNGLPAQDLEVTADHGMIVDGMVINASALVNGGSIDFVPTSELPEVYTVYHVETENHDVIFANGAPSETFIDIPGRMAYDNYQEYLDLYGAERILPEMNRPRITSRRLLPETLKARLGIIDTPIEWDAQLSA